MNINKVCNCTNSHCNWVFHFMRISMETWTVSGKAETNAHTQWIHANHFSPPSIYVLSYQQCLASIGELRRQTIPEQQNRTEIRYWNSEKSHRWHRIAIVYIFYFMTSWSARDGEGFNYPHQNNGTQMGINLKSYRKIHVAYIFHK